MRVCVLCVCLVGWVSSWSLERLESEYLACAEVALEGRLDVFTSFRSIGAPASCPSCGYSLFARDFYNSWLSYWPVGLGRLVIYSESDAKTVEVVRRLIGCLEGACSEPGIDFRTFDLHASLGLEHKVGGTDAGVNANFTAVDDVRPRGRTTLLFLMCPTPPRVRATPTSLTSPTSDVRRVRRPREER